MSVVFNMSFYIKVAKLFAALLLLFNGAGAIYGGWNLMMHPDGASIHLPADLLKHTHFPNYFIPGLILFIANGVCSIGVLLAVIFNFKNYSWMIIGQGIILTVWVIVQIGLFQNIFVLQIIFGFLGMELTGIGALLYHYHRKLIL